MRYRFCMQRYGKLRLLNDKILTDDDIILNIRVVFHFYPSFIV